MSHVYTPYSSNARQQIAPSFEPSGPRAEASTYRTLGYTSTVIVLLQLVLAVVTLADTSLHTNAMLYVNAVLFIVALLVTIAFLVFMIRHGNPQPLGCVKWNAFTNRCGVAVLVYGNAAAILIRCLSIGALAAFTLPALIDAAAVTDKTEDIMDAFLNEY